MVVTLGNYLAVIQNTKHTTVNNSLPMYNKFFLKKVYRKLYMDVKNKLKSSKAYINWRVNEVQTHTTDYYLETQGI